MYELDRNTLNHINVYRQIIKYENLLFKNKQQQKQWNNENIVITIKHLQINQISALNTP